EQFAGLLLGKSGSFSSKLPSDLEVLDVKVDLFSKQVSLVVRSDSFDDVLESMSVPELGFVSASTAAPVPTPASVPLAETKPATPKPAIHALKVEPKHEAAAPIAKPTPPPVSRYAAKMENEFSPEQRKLLSFTVKGDSVVVKPVMFLKAEWDDINGVVRSLGGRWVKGDIISYWEIPLQ
ncbi:MAG TPA: hypothetical protein VLH35_04595, partial [Candidatus Acidoferrales bacterium]|nr:hypothetical protein [Candidatus Acidoferrales bacterium]